MKTMYLVQRGVIKEINKKFPLSKAINFDYMGAAEFEFGALPKSLKFIKENFDKYKNIRVKKLKNYNNNELIVFHPFNDEEFEDYKQYLIRLSEGKLQTKGYTAFYCNFISDDKLSELTLKCDRKFNFWWDIENNVMFHFSKNLKNSLPDILINSFKKMDENK